MPLPYQIDYPTYKHLATIVLLPEFSVENIFALIQQFSL